MIPSLFIAHGAPTIVLEDNSYTQYLSELARKLPKPRAIVLFSAHWESGVQQVSGIDAYPMIYDFHGFPDELYEIVYPAKGDAAVTNEVVDLFHKKGILNQVDISRGMDHGAWAVLRLLYPDADIPVVVLSVNPALTNREQYRIGEALKELRQKDILVIGSGGTVHNLRRLSWRSEGVDDWAVKFDDWLKQKLEDWDTEALFRYEAEAPHALDAVPRNEHFIPLLLAMGAADDSRKAALLHRSYQYGNLSLSAWSFGV